MTMNIDIPSLLASADRRTLAAVVTHHSMIMSELDGIDL
jgi:hypothetical protein